MRMGHFGGYNLPPGILIKYGITIINTGKPNPKNVKYFIDDDLQFPLYKNPKVLLFKW